MKLSKNIVLTSKDILKGYVTTKNFNSTNYMEVTPWQMVELEDKTHDWKEWNADYFEWIGLNNVKQNARRVLKNRRLASGILDMEDYMISDTGDISKNLDFCLPEETQDSFNKFHPLLPPYIKVLDGEFLKRNLRVHVSCTDRDTENDKLNYKKELVDQSLFKLIQSQKQQALKKLGIELIDPQSLENTQEVDMQKVEENNQKYYSEMDAARELGEAQTKYKNYRHIFEQFGQHVLNKAYDKFDMAELEREAFLETLCNAKEYWHIDLLEDDFKVEFLDSANCFKHTSHNIKYSSDGDYFGWFENMTVGDIVNKFGKKLSSKQFENLKGTLESFGNGFGGSSGASLVVHEQNMPGAYYDSSKPYPQAAQNKPMVDYWRGEYLDSVANNFKNKSSTELAQFFGSSNNLGQTPKMFRVMRLYWKSQKKIGWLVKKDRTGQTIFQDWIDENFKQTVEPIYDNTITKEKTKDNLVYGEHIDWEWSNDWRHIIKINNNIDNTYWKNQNTYSFEPIYIDGDSVKFQFTGNKDNPYEVSPPIEGVEFKMKQTRPVSFVDLLAPTQIYYNIAMNKVPQIMFDDIGMVMAYSKTQLATNSPDIKSVENAREDMLRTLKEDKIFEYTPPDKDIMMQFGNALPVRPEVLDYSRIKEGLLYLDVAARLRQTASQVIGISDSRLAQSKASQTATGVENDINYSETQTEPYFHQHIVEFMPKVYQKILEAAQYYCTLHESARVSYQTTDQENIFLEVENLDGLPRNYNIKCTSDIKESVIKEKLQSLFLNNNTTDASLLELASGISKDSPSEILEVLRVAQIKREKTEEKKYKQEMEAQQAERDAAKQQQSELLAYQTERDRLDRESEELIAEIRALGGIQTDSDANGITDALDNLRQDRIIDNNQSNFDNKMKFDMQKHQDNLSLQERNMMMKQSIEQKKLAIALVNQNAQTDKKLTNKVAKQQGVTK